MVVGEVEEEEMVEVYLVEVSMVVKMEAVDMVD